MRILHLAYEDPAQPGSGGGSVRTREINRRLAQRHEITCMVAGYRGARPREEDGIRWVPLGLSYGVRAGRLAYFLLLREAVRRFPHDLLIEDFGAPFSVGWAPMFTNRPVIASVQWLFAAEMRRKYHLPFDWVEHMGLPIYRRFIAVSDWLARSLRLRCPRASVQMIPNGVEAAAFAVERRPPQHLLFVGRLDSAQKGCDLLLQSFARAAALLGDLLPPLVIVGDGPDRASMERQAAQLGIARRVEFRGYVAGVEKFELMAQSYAVLMPSRFETFGLVAAEALACAAPLVAFDVGPLREVAGDGVVFLVPPFDCEGFARAITRCVQPSEVLDLQRQAGRLWARRYSWDGIAAQQEASYEAALTGAC